MVMMKTACEYVTGDNPSRQNQTTKTSQTARSQTKPPHLPISLISNILGSVPLGSIKLDNIELDLIEL